MNKYILFIVFVLGLFSCNTKENIHSPLYSFNINPSEAKNTKFSDLFEGFEEIVIPTTVSIGRINKVILQNDTIIIFDGLAQQIVILNDHGDVLSKIKKQGKGPGEYTRLADICYVSNKNLIFALDFNAHKILVYNIDGTFVKDIKLNVTASSIESNANGELFLYTSGSTHLIDNKIKYNVVKINDVGNIIDLLIPYVEPLDNMLTRNPFTKFGDEVFIHYGVHDTIFNISKNMVVPCYAKDVKGALPFSKLFENPNVEIESQQSVSKHGFMQSVLIGDNIVNFNYVNKGFVYKYYFNIKTKRYKNIKSLEDDYYQSETYFPIALRSKTFYFIIHPVDIKSQLILDKHNVRKDNIDNLNPFIVKCKLREF